MKITPRPARGMTLLELTVVIIVLLTLIGILFIGTEAWRAGANQSGCILNIRNAQTAVRAYQNVRDAKEGDSITIDSRKLLLQLNVPEDVIAKRRAAWKRPAPRYTRGLMAKYMKLVGPATKGAVTDL